MKIYNYPFPTVATLKGKKKLLWKKEKKKKNMLVFWAYSLL